MMQRERDWSNDDLLVHLCLAVDVGNVMLFFFIIVTNTVNITLMSLLHWLQMPERLRFHLCVLTLPLSQWHGTIYMR